MNLSRKLAPVFLVVAQETFSLGGHTMFSLQLYSVRQHARCSDGSQLAPALGRPNGLARYLVLQILNFEFALYGDESVNRVTVRSFSRSISEGEA